MWICFNDAFVSAVQDRGNPERLCVRARNPTHLHSLFPTHPVIDTPNADYACRIFITKAEFAELVARRVGEISYPNFKDSVEERRLHDLYADFWSRHMTYQHEVKEDRARRFRWEDGDVQSVTPPSP